MGQFLALILACVQLFFRIVFSMGPIMIICDKQLNDKMNAKEIAADSTSSTRQHLIKWVRNLLKFIQMSSDFLNILSHKWVLLSKSRCRSNHDHTEVPLREKAIDTCLKQWFLQICYHLATQDSHESSGPI